MTIQFYLICIFSLWAGLANGQTCSLECQINRQIQKNATFRKIQQWPKSELTSKLENLQRKIDFDLQNSSDRSLITKKLDSLDKSLPSLDLVLKQAKEILWQEKMDDGLWRGKARLGPYLTAEYVLFLKIMEQLSSHDEILFKKTLLKFQNADGGFSNWGSGPSHVLTSKMIYYALKILKADSFTLGRLEKWLVVNEGFKESYDLLIANYLAHLAGLRSMPVIPDFFYLWPFLLNVPGAQVQEISTWGKSLLVPFSVVHFLDQCSSNWAKDPVRKWSFDILQNELSLLTDKRSGQVFFFSSSAIWGTLAYRRLQLCEHRDTENDVKKGVLFLESLLDKSKGGIEMLFPSAINWEVPLALNALLDYPGIEKNYHALYRLNVFHDDSLQAAWSPIERGKSFPDTEGTGKVLTAIMKKMSFDQNDALLASKTAHWLLSMQTDGGGWATFQKQTRPKTPGELSFDLPLSGTDSSLWGQVGRVSKILNDSILLYDYPAADLTAHVLESLAHYGLTAEDYRVRKAVQFLKNDLGKNKLWYARYGVGGLWATEAVISALHELGADTSSISWLRPAIEEIKSSQNKKGYWGFNIEALSHFDAPIKDAPASVVQTSLAVIALIHAGEIFSPQVEKGIGYLTQQFNSDEMWSDPHFRGLGGIFLVDYDFLPKVMPLQAIDLYRRTIDILKLQQGNRP